MSIAIPVDELYFLMGANAIGFVPESPLNKAFEQLTRTAQDFNAEKLPTRLYAKGLIQSTESLQPVEDLRHKIEIVADPDAFYSAMARIYNKILFTEYYEKNGEIVEFGCKNNTCYFNEIKTRNQFTESIKNVLNGTVNPHISSMQFTIPEYVLLGAAFYLQGASDLTGPVESLGRPMYFTIGDLKELITTNPKFDIIDALSELGSSYEHSMLVTDPSIFRKEVEHFVVKGYFAWVDPEKELLTIGPAVQKFYTLATKPSALFISLASSNLETYDWKDRLSFFWSDQHLFKVSFAENNIIFSGIEKEEVPKIIRESILLPVPEQPPAEEEEKAGTEEAPETKTKSKTLKFCPKCGWKNERGTAFCPRCGKPLTRA